MTVNRIVLGLFCVGSALTLNADTIVGNGETLTVTNTESLSTAPLWLGTGATLSLAGGSATEAGLNEYTRSSVTALGTPALSSYGTWTRITSDAYWASTNFTATSTEYIYTGRWHIPASGVYSVFEHIDDAALIAIDGQTVLQNSSYNTPTCVRDLTLPEGWHELELRVYNGNAGGGLTASNLLSGLLFSPSNDLISIANQTNAFAFADPGDGSVLQAVHNGTIVPKIYVAHDATLDLSQQALAGPLNLLGGLLPATNATAAAVTVSGGSGRVFFGMPNQSVHFSPFNADVAFEGVADPQGVTFRDYSTAIAWPTSCAWRVADNATVALYGTNMLGIGDITLTNHNIYVLSPYAVTPDATIHVQGTNLTASIKPCTLDAQGNWSGANLTITNNISLEGVGSRAYFPINVAFALQGTISGTGSVVKVGAQPAEILEPCDFVGPVTVSDTSSLIFDAATAGDSNNTVTVNAGASLSLRPSGAGTSDTTAWIKWLHGGGSTGQVTIPAKQTLTVDTFDGALSVQGAGSTLHVNTLGTNATLVVSGQTAVTIGATSPGATLKLYGGTALNASAITFDNLILASGDIPVSGDFSVALLGGSGRLVKQGPDTTTVYFSTNSAGVRVDAGALVLAPPATNSVLGNLPALWLDASASGVFTQYKSYVFTNGFINIERWNDCRPGAPYYGYNDRGNDNRQVYPYVMTNSQNGLPVVSMGSYQLTLTDPYIGPDGYGIEARRLPLSTNLYPQFAVMVYGSQLGGGSSLFGGSTAFYRAGSTAAEFRTPATAVFSSAGAAYPAWTNGVSMTATNTGFSGGYQIVSVNTKGQLINALGWRGDPASAGGQNYGEVLLYTNTLTTLQRLTAEAYLAKKWDLPFGLSCTLSNVTVAAGATLEVGDTFSVARLLGSGNVIVSTGQPFQPAGLFTGSVTLNGGTFVVSDTPAPPTAEEIPTANLSCWFDPCQTNRIVFGGQFTPSRPLSIAAIYDRTTTERFLIGTCNTDNTYDRRPWLSATNGPSGETQYWMDYSNVYSGDSNGNTLRLYRNPTYIGTSTTGQQTPTNVQSGFIVLDSSRGGGVPITYDVTASSVFVRPNYQTASSPIWGSASASAVKAGQTFLDGVAVNGTNTGYSGTTELLSFVTTNAVQAAFFGFYGGDGASGNLNRERLGEIILFDSALSVGSRAAVEAYLMRKWLGKLREGYSDLSSVTVAGAGTLRANDPSWLPQLDPGFTGTVELTADAFAYTLGTNGVGDFVASPVTDIPGTLAVPAAGTLTVHFAVRPPAGLYPLVTCGAMAGDGFSGWSLTTDGDVPNGTVSLKASATGVTLSVTSPGTLFLLQ